MGAKKDKDVKILSYKSNFYKTKKEKMREFKVPEPKALKAEEKQERYEAWLEQVEQMNDY
jgi:hypothetical protein